MLADSFSKTAVLALAAMAQAKPFFWESSNWKSGNSEPSKFEHGKFEHGKFEHGKFEHGNWDHGNWDNGDWDNGDWDNGDCDNEQPGKEEPVKENPGKEQPGTENPGKEQPGAGGSSDFKSQMLAAHNWYRGQHSAAALKWDDNLASKSLAWASKCSSNPRHEPNQPYGENIASGTSVSKAYEWVNLWGKERRNYNWNQSGFAAGTGHFTQVVWKGTTSVGCAETKCSSGSNVVCKYDPPGNMMGDFEQNVGRQTSGHITDEYQG
ncbi:hypothetical protein MY10362_006185 [Beauveria mimosiformis]